MHLPAITVLLKLPRILKVFKKGYMKWFEGKKGKGERL